MSLVFLAISVHAGSTTVATAPTISIVSHSTATLQPGATVSVALARIDTLISSNSSVGQVTNFWLNVKNPPYNAKGNASADDSGSIQKALNDVHSMGGGTVFFPEGTYIIGTRLTIYPTTTLQGSGISATTLQAKNNLNDRLMRNAAISPPDNDIVLQDMLFDMNGSTQSASTTPTFSNTNRHAVRRCEFRNAYDSLYELTGSPNITLNNNAVYEDVFFNGVGQNQATDLVDIGDGTNIWFERVRFVGAKTGSNNGMMELSFIDHLTINNSYFDGQNNGVPIVLKGINNGKLDGGEIKGSSSSGMEISTWNELPPFKIMENFDVTNTSFHDNVGAGVVLQVTDVSTNTCRNITFSNDNFFSNGHEGVNVKLANVLTFIGNQFYNNSTATVGGFSALSMVGPFGLGDINRVRLVGNTFYDNQTSHTQSQIYTLTNVSTFTAQSNFYNNVSIFKNVTTSSNTLFLDQTYEGGRYFIGSTTWNLANASGNSVVTGVGFAPISFNFTAGVDGGLVATESWSSGNDNGTTHESMANIGTKSFFFGSDSIVAYDGVGTNFVTGHVTAIGSDGFTLSFVKTGSPTGTLTIYYTASR